MRKEKIHFYANIFIIFFKPLYKYNRSVVKQAILIF